MLEDVKYSFDKGNVLLKINFKRSNCFDLTHTRIFDLRWYIFHVQFLSYVALITSNIFTKYTYSRQINF